jgi:hypothetical protein
MRVASLYVLDSYCMIIRGKAENDYLCCNKPLDVFCTLAWEVMVL